MEFSFREYQRQLLLKLVKRGREIHAMTKHDFQKSELIRTGQFSGNIPSRIR